MDTHRDDIRALTGLRGIAALWVVVFHVMLLVDFPWPLKWLIGHGYMAVDVFFVLSGFDMALSYRHLFLKGVTKKSYAIFMLRRIARVYPLYFFATLFVVIINALHISHSWPFDFAELIGNFTLTQTWGIGKTIDGPAWSVSTELGAYILFPFMMLVPLKSVKFTIALCILSFVTMLWLYVMNFGVPGPSGPLDIYRLYSPLPLVRCISEFILGVCTFRIAHSGIADYIGSRKWLQYLPFLGFTISAAFIYSDIVMVFFIPFMVLILARQPSFTISRFMASRPIFFMGEISYSLYLLHYEFQRVRQIGKPLLIKHGMAPIPADIIASTILYGSLIIASYLAFRFVEVPARKALRRLEDRLKPDAGKTVLQSELAGRSELVEPGRS